jgi:hypothetical protein
MSKYLFKPVKHGYVLEDENKNIVYETKMIKFKLLGASPYEFINHITNTKEEHNIGKTVVTEAGINDLMRYLSRKSYFKIDNENVWQYLRGKGINIETNGGGIKAALQMGMKYIITYNDSTIATMIKSTSKDKPLITRGTYYDIECEEKNLDLVFITALAIAKTEDAMYD